jgi:long-chain fatty acid transport protein
VSGTFHLRRPPTKDGCAEIARLWASIATRFLLLPFVIFGVSSAFAGSGFELRSQSAAVLESAQAGMTASATDLTTAVFNPASLAFGSGTEVALTVTGLFTAVQFSGNASTVLGTAVGGDQGGNAGTSAAVPNLYLATDLSAALRAGLAVSPRFGLGSYWSGAWIGRYYAVTSKLSTVDVIPSMSYRVDNSLSFGLAGDVQYAKITATNAVDFGTIDRVLFGGASGGIPAGNDGSTRSTADSWGVGFAAGVLYEPEQGTRIGIDYHSRIEQRLRGNASFGSGATVGQSIALATGAFMTTDIRSDLTLPATAAVGIYHEIDSDWAIMADAMWSEWRVLQSLDITFSNPAQPPVQTAFAWRDSWFFALGARCRVNDKLALRFGAAYDQSPTRNETRTPAIPDSDSYWLAAGFEYRLTPRAKLDIAYGHIFASNATIGLSASAPGNTFRGNLTGDITGSSVNYLSMALNYKF